MTTAGEGVEGPSVPVSTVAMIKRRSQRRRRDAMPIKVRVDDQELEIISSNAAGCGLTNAEFLRRLGKGLIPTSKLDQVHVRELCLVAGDLGRLGGLLKFWLSEHRNGGIPKGEVKASEVDGILREIQELSGILKEKVLKL